MEDEAIVELFWQRCEAGLTEAERKYASYCHAIAYRILANHEDAEECVNDTFARAWGAIPPARPQNLRMYLGKITRNLSLNARESARAAKRGAGQVPVLLSELDECLINTPSDHSAEDSSLTEVVNTFLHGLDASRRRVFVRRYWYAGSLDEIAADYGLSVSSVKSMLFRLRQELKRHLEREGITR